jgi:hypothetical protein
VEAQARAMILTRWIISAPFAQETCPNLGPQYMRDMLRLDNSRTDGST